MKFKEILTINESTESDLDAQKAIHDLDVIGSTLSQMPPEKENLKLSVVNKLQQMSKSISSFLSRAKIQQQNNNTVQNPAPTIQPQPSTTEDVNEANVVDASVLNTIKTLKEQIKAIEASNIEENVKKQFISPMRKSLDQLSKQVKELTTAKDIALEKQKEAETFVKEVSGYLIELGNKVQGFEEEDTGSMTSKEKSLAVRRAANAAEFTKTLKQALFGKIVDIQTEADVTPKEIKDFLAACVRGDIINMLSVTSTNRGNIKDHVNPQYKKLFDIFVEQNIFSYSPGKTSGAIGPGEMALSMMGNPAEKAKKGDLKVGDMELEIKASARTGGRLNSKSISKATAGWQVWKRNIASILSSAPKNATMYITDKKGERVKIAVNKFNGDQYNKPTGGRAKLGSKYNWNPKGFQLLNEEILAPYSDFNKTFQLFDETIKAMVLNIDKIKNADKLIASAVNQDGTVNSVKMNKAYSKIAYESYHLADGITSIMLLNTLTLDYTIIKDGNDLVKQISSNTVYMPAGFNWNDDQQTPTPSYMPSKL